MARPKARYYVYDRSSREASGLAGYSTMRARFLIVDRATGLPVDEASTRYEARQAAELMNLQSKG